MRVLAVDSASPSPALALFVEPGAEGVPDAVVESLGAGRAEALVRRVQELLSKASLALPALDRIAVLSGPGSFTGLRAGTAFARGLARSLEIPLVLRGTFTAASAALAEPVPVDFLLDAGRGEVHRARRRDGGLHESERPLPRQVALAEATQEGVAVRDLNADPLPLAVPLARLAAAADVREPGGDSLGVSLRYGRPSAAEERFGPPR